MCSQRKAADGTPEALASRLQQQPAFALRLARQVAERRQLPPPAVTVAVRGGAAILAEAPPAAVRGELTALLLSPGAPLALQWFYDTGALGVLLPELAATVDLSQEAGRRHKDVWEHTKLVVAQSPSRVAIRWAALLHDIGKVRTRGMSPSGRVHFHGHAEVGAHMFDDIARRLRLGRPLRQQVRFLILYHLRPNQYLRSWTDSAVRRFDRELQPWLDDLLDLSRADITSRRPGRRQEALELIDELWRRIVALREADAQQPPLPTGLGTSIMERFGLSPCRRVGELRRRCEEAVARGELEAQREADYYLEYLSRTLPEEG